MTTRKKGVSRKKMTVTASPEAELHPEPQAEVEGESKPVLSSDASGGEEAVVEERALGWTDDLTRALRWARDFNQLALEVDVGVLHLVTAMGSINRGDFDLARYNLFCAGLVGGSG